MRKIEELVEIINNNPDSDIPMITYRLSLMEWSMSGNVTDKESSKTVAASGKETSCLSMLAAALFGFHSNFMRNYSALFPNSTK